jgi:AraC-like DNA-binding protein
MNYTIKENEKLYCLFYRGKSEGDREPQFSPPHCHNSYELLIVTRGYVDTVLNGETRRISAGEIMFIDSYDIHSFVFKDCERYSLVFSKEYCRMLLTDGKTLPSYSKCSEGEFLKITAMLDEYYSQYGESVPSGLLFEGLVSCILGKIELTAGKVERHEKPGDLIIKILDYIKENSNSDLSLSDVASKFGYTPNYFSSIFNKYVQMSFNDYLNYIRYTRAAEIILLQGCTASNIAMKCGFGSMNTYYRAKNKFDQKS